MKKRKRRKKSSKTTNVEWTKKKESEIRNSFSLHFLLLLTSYSACIRAFLAKASERIRDDLSVDRRRYLSLGCDSEFISHIIRSGASEEIIRKHRSSYICDIWTAHTKNETKTEEKIREKWRITVTKLWRRILCCCSWTFENSSMTFHRGMTINSAIAFLFDLMSCTSLKWGRMPKSSSLQMKILTNIETHTWNLRKTFSIFHLLPPLLLFEDMRRLLCLPTCFHDEIPRISFTEPDQLTLTHGVGPWAGSRKKNEEKEEMKKTSFRVSNCFCFLIKFTNDIAKQRCKKRVKSRVSSSPYNDIRPRTTPIVQETHKELR